MSTKNKNYNMVGQYDGKKVISIASYQGVSERQIKIIEKGLRGVIKNCNEIQSDIEIELFYLDDNNVHTIGIMVPDDCVYEDETVKRFFLTQLATVSGLFYQYEKGKC